MITNLFKHWTYRVFAPGTVLQATYSAFQELLACDHLCHEMMSELESIYYQGKKEDFCKICLKYDALVNDISAMVHQLEQMNPGAYVDLPSYLRKFDFYARYFLAPPKLNFGEPFVGSLKSDIITTELAGSKTTTLVELSKTLNLQIPEGFLISTNCFSYLLEYNNLRPSINALLAEIDIQNLPLLAAISTKLQTLIETSEIPTEIQRKIHEIHNLMPQQNPKDSLLAIRSSALSEDGQCSFAGQYNSFLNVTEDQLITSYLKVLSSKYSPEALAYRINCGLSDEETPMAVMVLRMINPISAGVMYTVCPSGTDNKTIFIHAAEGLGDTVVSGTTLPEVYAVPKLLSHSHISNLSLNNHFLTNNQIETLHTFGLKIEQHFGKPQDIEWALDQDGKFVFLQSRPLHMHQYPVETSNHISDKTIKPLFCSGVMASSGNASGKAWCLDTLHTVDCIEEGSILIIRETLPGYARILHRVNGVIAELGSSAGHFATVCREFGIPLLLGVKEDNNRIKHGQQHSIAADDTRVYLGNKVKLTKKIPSYIRDKDLPFFRKLRSVLKFITPLNLVDHNSKDFLPESCRSLHDIIRFSHEMAVRNMFSIGDRCSGQKGTKKKLQTTLPFEMYLVDVDNGFEKIADTVTMVTINMIRSIPFQALWNGLNHRSIIWEEQAYYDWKSYDKIAMTDAFAFQSDKDSASYAVLGEEYLNINIRFGYHFTVIDALCTPDSNNSYCTMRFAGGGGDFAGRELRILFLNEVLTRLGFEVIIKGDLLDARISGISSEVLIDRIELLGKLLGITKQMDMRLKNITMVTELVEAFFNGKYSGWA